MNQLNEQPEIYVLIGLPGSGKSTWTQRKLASSGKAFAVISSDNHLEAMAKKEGIGYSEAWKKYIGEATGRMKQDFRDAVAAGQNIIWDQTNLSKKKRRGILQQVPAHYIKVAVDFNVEDRELMRRLADRAEKTGKHIPETTIKEMGKTYQAPSKDEGFDKIERV